MSELLKWDEVGKHLYEIGVRRGVLYVQDTDGTYGNGEAWNGLSAVTQSPSGAEPTKIYADDINYLNVYSAEEFGATIEAYTYPKGFALCNGEASIADGVTIGQQPRRAFGFCYRSVVGNDIEGEAYGYKLHFIYGAKASPSERSHSTINDSPEPSPFSWEITTTPVNVTGFQPTAYVCVDSKTVDSAKLAALEAIIYGTEAVEASDAVYEQVPASAVFDNSKTYYTRTGSGTTESPYSYSVADINAFADAVTYYTMKTPAQTAADAVAARLPLPDEIASVLG